MAFKTVVSGLDAIEALLEKANKDYDDSPKAKWLSLKGGSSEKIWFLQELDENSKHYDPKAGTLFIAIEHSSPQNFRKKALCTKESEGHCFACEMAAANPKKGWHQRSRLYANVLVVPSKDEPYVAVLSQGISGKSITPSLTQMARDYGGITQTQFRIRRDGSDMNSTSYTIIPLFDVEKPDTSKYELYDLEEVATRSVPYDEQPEFYEVDESPATGEAEGEKDFEWA